MRRRSLDGAPRAGRDRRRLHARRAPPSRSQRPCCRGGQNSTPTGDSRPFARNALVRCPARSNAGGTPRPYARATSRPRSVRGTLGGRAAPPSRSVLPCGSFPSAAPGRWPNDDDWPTWSPHHTVTPATKRAGDLLRDFLRGKNVIFVGDSINSLVVSSFLCDAAREGFPQIVRAPRHCPRPVLRRRGFPVLRPPASLLAPHRSRTGNCPRRATR